MHQQQPSVYSGELVLATGSMRVLLCLLPQLVAQELFDLTDWWPALLSPQLSRRQKPL